MTKSDKWNKKKLFVENKKVNQVDIDLTVSTNSDIEDVHEQQNILKIEPKNEVTLNIEADSIQKNLNLDEEALVDVSEGDDLLNIQAETLEDKSTFSFPQGQKGEPDEPISQLSSETVADAPVQKKRIPIIPVISEEVNSSSESPESLSSEPLDNEGGVLKQTKKKRIPMISVVSADDTKESKLADDGEDDNQLVDASKGKQTKKKRIPIIPVMADEEEQGRVGDEVSTVESVKEETISVTNQSTVKKQVLEEDPLMNKITSILIYVICFLILIICGLVLYGTLTNRLFTHREQAETTLVVKQMSEISSELVSESMIEEAVKPTALVPRPKL